MTQNTLRFKVHPNLFDYLWTHSRLSDFIWNTLRHSDQRRKRCKKNVIDVVTIRDVGAYFIKSLGLPKNVVRRISDLYVSERRCLKPALPQRVSNSGSFPFCPGTIRLQTDGLYYGKVRLPPFDERIKVPSSPGVTFGKGVFILEDDVWWLIVEMSVNVTKADIPQSQKPSRTALTELKKHLSELG